MNRPSGVNLFPVSQADARALGSVETAPLLRFLRPASFALWFLVFSVQIVMLVSDSSQSLWLALVLSTALFAGVHIQFWYEESEQGRRLHYLLERMRGRIYEDELTGLPNARHFVFELRRQMMRSMRNGRSFSVVLADLQGFESVGDGEEQERIARAAAKALRAAVGDSDFVARLQGGVFGAIVVDDKERTIAQKRDAVVLAVASAIPLERSTAMQPVVTMTGYEGELEVRELLRRAQRDLQSARARGYAQALPRTPSRAAVA